MKRLIKAVVLAAIAFSPLHAQPVLKQGDRVAIIGDSITEQKRYSKFIELYLNVCVPQFEARCCQFGWSGEATGGFLRRMDNDLGAFKPTLATTCYGMNDAGYHAHTPDTSKFYTSSTGEVVKRLKAQGARVIVGGPGAVDTHYFGLKRTLTPAEYNDSLARLSAIAAEIATQNGFPHADVHGALIAAMAKAKAALGNEYDVCGKDGYHPGENGHLVMAYAFLKAMGLDGNIGTITVDLKGTATATDGHRVISATKGNVECESVRYPFCFTGDGKASTSARSILPFVPFNQELNRFTLIVKNLTAPRAKVTWGQASKSFTREQLAAGINLADEFLDNPFTDRFAAVEQAVATKQEFETYMIKNVVTHLPAMRTRIDGDAEVAAALDTLQRRVIARQVSLGDAVLAARQPVRHTIEIQAE